MIDHGELQKQMRAVRAKFGADTPTGHRASNVIEAIDSLPAYAPAGQDNGWMEFQRRNVDASIKRQLTDLYGMLA